ncbi:hypothetical protein ACSS6W_010872 [Trichoderma asperelloides]
MHSRQAKWRAIIDIQSSIEGMGRIQNHISEISISSFLAAQDQTDAYLPAK